MTNDYGFTVHFASAGANRTTMTMESFHTPANPLVAVTNKLMMERKFRGIMDALLGGLAELAARR